MGKKILIVVVVILIMAAVAVGVSLVTPEEPQKVYHVGILQGADSLAGITEGFKSKMTELGYVEGENIIYNLQEVSFGGEKQSQALQGFVSEGVDLIFAFATGPAIEAKTVTQGTSIPVVFAYASIEGNDLVEDVRQPGGNITGVREAGADITIKRLELLHEFVPEAKRIYITYDPNYPSIPPILESLRSAASSMEITLIEATASTIPEIQADLDGRAELEDLGMDAIMTMPQPLTQKPDGFLVIGKFAAEHSLPIGGHLSSIGGYSTLFGYEPEKDEIGELAASLADQVLDGIPAGTLPIVTPNSYLTINYEMAQELGLTVPESLLNQAKNIIR